MKLAIFLISILDFLLRNFALFVEIHNFCEGRF